jgi:hypothetical protein
MSKFINEPARDIPVRDEVDVLVVGGGPAGLMAAQAASKGKGRVMLIDQRGILGGNLTIGLPILSFLGRKGNQIIKGLPQQFIDRMRAKGAASEHQPCPNHVSITFIDPEGAMETALEVVKENNIEVLMYVFCCGVVMDGNTIKGVIIESKAGREVILAKQIIDCTGDGDVAFKAGAVCEKGDEDGGLQPPTLMFRMKGVNIPELRDALSNHADQYEMDVIPPKYFHDHEKFITVGLRQLINKARKDGLNMAVDRTIIITGLDNDEAWINMSRVSGVDSTHPESYTNGEIQARSQNQTIVEYLTKYVPGFENAWMVQTAPFMGIRESRRVEGEYMLTGDDIVSCRRFPDAIAVASYPIDLHHAKGGDCTMVYCEDSYDIPYRCLVPKTIDNLLVAGRCASTTHEAHGSTRVMSTCMALGEAAGTAARIAVADGVTPRKVNVDKVREALLAEGAYLGE